MATGIPKQVEEADRLAREFVAGLKNEEPEATEDESAEEEEKTEEDESEEDEEEVDTPEDDDSEEETEDDSEETDSDKEEDDDEDEGDKDWEQKYKTLEGMFKAETNRYNQELADMKAQVFERLGNIGQQPANQADTDEPESKPEEVAAFEEEMGPEYIEKLNKYMEYMLKPLVDSSVQPVAEKVDDVEDATLKAAQKQFSDYLDTKVSGDWQSLMEGKDDEFVEFLNSPDPSGLYTNGQLMKLYNDNWDADRLATLLNSYIGEPEAEKKPEKKKKTPNVQPKRKTPNSQPEEEKEKKIWTQADIKALEKAERDGKLSKEESDSQFADLLAAANEGRIRG